MSALPMDRPGQVSPLTRIAQSLAPLAQAHTQSLNDEHMAKVFAANPDFAQRLYGARNDRDRIGLSKQRNNILLERERREEQKRQALARFAESLGSDVPTDGGTRDALVRYAAVTGDPSKLLEYDIAMDKATRGVDSPASVKLANELQKARAAGDTQRVNDLLLSGKLLNKGVIFDDEGNADSIGGYNEVLSDQENAKRTGTLEADLALSPEIKEAEAAATERGRFNQEGFQSLPKVRRAMEAKELKEGFLDAKIDSIGERANALTTGFGGALLDAVPGSPAYDLKRDVETLLANAGFDRLQEMRDNSVTGGALGQVSERELSLLQAAAENLVTSQSTEQFKANLAAFKEQRRRSLKNIREAYEEDYKRFGGERDPNLPAPSKAAPKTIKWSDFE